MATWINSDGLAIDFGVDEADLGRVAGYRTNGPRRFVEIVVDGTEVPSASTVLDDKCVLPKGALIEEVRIGDVSQAMTGGNLNIGTISIDRTSNAAAAGLVSAATPAQVVTDSSTFTAGTQVKTVLAEAKFITWQATAAITAGRFTVRVYFSIPKKTQGQDTLVYAKP